MRLVCSAWLDRKICLEALRVHMGCPRWKLAYGDCCLLENVFFKNDPQWAQIEALIGPREQSIRMLLAGCDSFPYELAPDDSFYYADMRALLANPNCDSYYWDDRFFCFAWRTSLWAQRTKYSGRIDCLEALDWLAKFFLDAGLNVLVPDDLYEKWAMELAQTVVDNTKDRVLVFERLLRHSEVACKRLLQTLYHVDTKLFWALDEKMNSAPQAKRRRLAL